MNLYAKWLLAATTAAILLIAPALVQAQYPNYTPRYQSPYGSPISRYHDYFRADDAGLGSYYGIVLPNRVQSQAIRQQGQSILRQGAQLQQLRLRADQFQTQQFQGGQIAPTGVGGHFFDYSHYYSLQR